MAIQKPKMMDMKAFNKSNHTFMDKSLDHMFKDFLKKYGKIIDDVYYAYDVVKNEVRIYLVVFEHTDEAYSALGELEMQLCSRFPYVYFTLYVCAHQGRNFDSYAPQGTKSVKFNDI